MGACRWRIVSWFAAVFGGLMIFVAAGSAQPQMTPRFGEQFRMYLRDMGVEPELLDIVDRNSESKRQTDMPPAEWIRLRIVTTSSPVTCASRKRVRTKTSPRSLK
jgi:hypothetical protein